MVNSTTQQGFFKLRGSLVFDNEISDAEFRIFCALGVYADRDGFCYPAAETIAKRLGRSRQTVSDHVSALRKKKRLRSVRHKRPQDRHAHNFYKLCLSPTTHSNDGSAVIVTTAQPSLTRPVGTIEEEGGFLSGLIAKQTGQAEQGRLAYHGGQGEAGSAPLTCQTPFTEFCRAYPERGQSADRRAAAWMEFDLAMLATGTGAATIIRGAACYAEYARRRIKDDCYVKNSANWLRERHWTKYQTMPSTESAAPNAPRAGAAEPRDTAPPVQPTQLAADSHEARLQRHAEMIRNGTPFGIDFVRQNASDHDLREMVQLGLVAEETLLRHKLVVRACRSNVVPLKQVSAA